MSNIRSTVMSALDTRGLRWLRTCLKVLSISVSRGKAVPDAQVRQSLDRAGGRWLLGRLMTRAHDVQTLGISRVFWHKPAWVHEYPDGFVVVDTPGSRLPTLDSMDEQTRQTWEGYYSPQVGDVVIDVGAGIGTEAHRWSKLIGESGAILAIEAHPRTFQRLQVFCELNGLSNVRPINLAVTDSETVVQIEDLEEHEAASIVGTTGSIPVRGVTLDALLKEHDIDHVDLLKMNIEGAEVSALDGIRASAPRILRLCVSCHDFRAEMGHGEQFRTKRRVTEQLRTLGYTVEPSLPNPAPWIADQVYAHLPDVV